MKKYIVSIFVAVILLSCDTDAMNKTITNGSDYPVSFKYSYTGEYTLAPGQSVTFKGEKPYGPEYYTPQYRVYLEYSGSAYGGTGVFKNRTSYSVKVNNTLSEKVTLSDVGYMENPISNMAASTSGHTGKIYTDKPDFTVATESGYPANAAYSFDGSTFMVTIAW
jgi:hypothetical protein